MVTRTTSSPRASLPKFPKFESLKIEHKEAIENLVLTHIAPYSDFIFTNLWVWNIAEEIDISTLNGNLVVLMPGYTGEYSVLSFDGIKKVDDTIATLLAYSSGQAGIREGLEYIHEYIVRKIEHPDRLAIAEERHNFDYIISLKDSVNLTLRNNRSRRRNIERFERAYKKSAREEIIDITEPLIQKQVLRVFDRWVLSKNKISEKDVDDERAVLARFFTLGDIDNLQVLALYVDGTMIGFTIDEVINETSAVGHFMKALPDYRGAYQYLEHRAALRLLEGGTNFINIEQDLGIQSLRESKLGQHPTQLLPKYRISSE